MASLPVSLYAQQKLSDPDMQQRLAQSQNAVPLDTSTSIDGTPDPIAAKAFLEKEYQDGAAALRKITGTLSRQIIVARRMQIYRAGRAELYYLDKQKIFWNGSDNQWSGIGPGGAIVSADSYDAESFDFVTNFYKGYCESFMTTASQNTPGVPFHPEDPNRREDIEAARAATSASEYIARLNDAPMLMAKAAYHGFTGGLMASYTRSVVDGQRFGFEVDPNTGQLTNKPKQGEVISLHGALDISLPMMAENQHEADYLCWFVDMSRSKCQATYPWLGDNIPGVSDMRDDDLLARLFRAAVRGNIAPVMPSDAMDDIVTVLRIWLRPSTYWYITDKKVRQWLIDTYPSGCLVHYAGGKYAASFNEQMDDHWVIEMATEGRGLARPGIGESFIPVQDQINVLSNLFHKYLVYGIPPIFYHSKALNKEAISNMTAEVAQFLPVNMQDQLNSIQDLFWNPQAAQVPEALVSRLDALAGPIGQFLTGIFPALVGSDVEGVANKTAKGYAMQLQQSMGRVAFFYRRLRSFYQRTMYNTVREFANNRDKDVGLSTQDQTKKPQVIDPIKIRKGNFNIYPEADEGYPNLFSDKRDILNSFLEKAKEIPGVLEAMDEPSNQSQIKAAYGLADFVFPGEDSRLKQLKEIGDMLMAGRDPQMDPTAPMEPLPIQPLDRDDVEFETCKWWASTDAGIDAAVENPLGYEAIMNHADLHQKRMATQAPKPEIKRSISIASKDMPPEALAQELEKAGDTVNPQDFAVKHAMDKDLTVAAHPPKPDAPKSKDSSK